MRFFQVFQPALCIRTFNSMLINWPGHICSVQIATPRLLGYMPGCTPLTLCLICFLAYVVLFLLKVVSSFIATFHSVAIKPLLNSVLCHLMVVKILTGLLLLAYSYKMHPETGRLHRPEWPRVVEKTICLLFQIECSSRAFFFTRSTLEHAKCYL